MIPRPSLRSSGKSVASHRLGGGKWWDPDYFDRLIRTGRQLSETINYVYYNPEKASLRDWDFRRMYPERIADCI